MRIHFPACLFSFSWLFSFYGNNDVATKSSYITSTDTLPQREIIWDSTTITRISPPSVAAFYPRMIQLRNGQLLAAYATGGNVVTTISPNGGKTWTEPTIVATQRDEVNMDTPDLLQTADGTTFICYGTRPRGALRGKPDSTKHFEIRLQRSTDDGIHWQEEKVLYTAGTSFKDGCWEPSMIQLPSGMLQLFFANEGIYTKSNEQNISMLQSADNGAHWTTTPQIISFRAKSRDGMPVPMWLPHLQKIAVAIEDNGSKNFKPYVVYSSADGRWNNIIDGKSSDRRYALQQELADTIYAGAPYIRRLSSGETILSYQSTEGRAVNRDHNAVMRVAVGDKDASRFGDVSTPFAVAEGYNALWNSLCVLQDDTIIAITSTNGYSKKQPEVWMVKGRLIK